MGDENQTDGDTITYQDLETAAFHNNAGFILHWLQNSDLEKRTTYKWLSDLLRRAAYFHSVDVVASIVTYGGLPRAAGQLESNLTQPNQF